VQKCKDACCQAKWCKSFDYHKNTAECDLSSCSAEEKGGLKTNYENNPYNHYARENTAGKLRHY
jgi:hypothetical protein